MAGRPSLRIGEHGKIRRVQLDKGIWKATCRYRDTDGVTRVVERRSTGGDTYGKKAEDLLLASLASRQPPGVVGEIHHGTKVVSLIETHIERSREDWAARTTDTYTYTAGQLAKLIKGLRVEEATPPRIDAALRSMKRTHGPGMARQSKTLLLGGLQLAVMAGVLPTNPAKSVTGSRSKDARGKGAKALDTNQIAELLEQLRVSDVCIEKDLADPITLLIATGLRRSELLGLRWVDYDPLDRSVTVTGKLVRIKGQGLKRISQTKTDAGRRTIPLPLFASDMLTARKRTPYYGEQKMIFPSTAGTWRDPDNFNKDWRKARELLGFPDVTSHSFRKTVATVIDEEGLSARVGADHLGHAKISMTQDVYMARNRTHSEVADALDRIVNGDG